MWMKVDDGLHAHRKTRAVTKSHPEKDRDAGPMGLWVLAGSWSGRNNRDGWVPIDELDRFDDDWEELARRLVHAGYWWPEQRDGEDGYGFNDWHEWNSPDAASESGTFGNHVRWHVQKGVVKPDCNLCPKEPEEPEEPESIPPISGGYRGDHRPESGGESLRDHRPDSLTRARPEPDQNQENPCAPATADDATGTADDGFEEFWDTYDKKTGRKAAQQKWRLALKKRGVTADLLIRSAAAYVRTQKAEGKHPKYTKDATRWLNGEHWNDEQLALDDPLSDQGWQTHWTPPPCPPEIADDPERYADWLDEQRHLRAVGQ